MSVRILIAFTLLTLAFLPSANAQEVPAALYMTDAGSSTEDARLLSSEAPTGDPATLQFSPAAGVPDDTFDWVTGTPASDDLVLSGTATVELHFDAGIDAASTTTVTILAVTDDGTERELGRADDATPGQAAPHMETLDVDVDGANIFAGERVLLRITVSDAAALVQLQYDGADAASGITEWPAAILDSDGDGFGDSAERRAGTDPQDPDDTPDDTEAGSGSEGTTGGSDPGAGAPGGDDSSGPTPPTSIEPLVGAFLLVLCLALAGYAIFVRYPA